MNIMTRIVSTFVVASVTIFSNVAMVEAVQKHRTGLRIFSRWLWLERCRDILTRHSDIVAVV